jgi:Sulfotransferase family
MLAELRPRDEPPPLVIGGVGFSGTRVVARIVSQAGISMGADLNETQDSLSFFDFAEGWSAKALQASSGGSPAVENGDLARELADAIDAHRHGIPSANAPWGWKQPRSIHFLPLLHRLYPGLRFVHVIRDGLDLAFGAEVGHRLAEGRRGTGVYSAAAGMADDLGDRPVQIQMALFWARVNSLGADYGEAELGASYLRVRLEDLCSDPEAGCRELLAFALGVAPDPVAVKAAAAEVRPPSSLGLADRADPRLRAEAGAEIAGALRRFGYPVPGVHPGS